MVGSCCGHQLYHGPDTEWGFGRTTAELLSYAPAQSDLLIVAGVINIKTVAMIRETLALMPSPKWVMAFGVCSISGGLYKDYSVKPLASVIPVDVNVYGCPPDHTALTNAIKELKQVIQQRNQEHHSKQIRDGA